MSVTDLWDGSCAKYLHASSYDMGCSPFIISDKSMSKVGARLLKSDPKDTWIWCQLRAIESTIELLKTFSLNVSFKEKDTDKKLCECPETRKESYITKEVITKKIIIT